MSERPADETAPVRRVVHPAPPAPTFWHMDDEVDIDPMRGDRLGSPVRLSLHDEGRLSAERPRAVGKQRSELLGERDVVHAAPTERSARVRRGVSNTSAAGGSPQLETRPANHTSG